MADMDDSGSPTDDSEEEGSDASLSGEKEVTKFVLAVCIKIKLSLNLISIVTHCRNQLPVSEIFQKGS